MTVSTPRLAALLADAAHLAEGARLAAFLRGAGVAPVANPFPATSAGAVRQVWAARAFEYGALGRETAGLTALLVAVAALDPAAPLVQDILRAGPHTLHLYRAGERVVGAVLAGLPGVPLPEVSTGRADPVAVAETAPGSARLAVRRARRPSAQLDLFAAGL